MIAALAALAFFRSIAGFCFPLFAPAMYSALGYGKGDTILACFAIAVGVPAYVHSLCGDRLLLTTPQALPLLDLRRAHTECEPLCQEVILVIMCRAACYNTQIATWRLSRIDVHSLDRRSA